MIFSCVRNLGGYDAPVPVATDFQQNGIGVEYSSGMGGFAMSGGDC